MSSLGKTPTHAANSNGVPADMLTRVHLHTALVTRMLHDPHGTPEEFACFLEDVANAYLDIAEDINRYVIEHRIRD